MKMWDVEEYTDTKITFGYTSKDMEQGFPGNCQMHVTYEVTEQNEFKITYHIVSDKKTVINMTNHSYFNLAGQENGNVLDQDYLGIGAEGRINTPSTLGGNWVYRIKPDAFDNSLISRIRRLTQICGRLSGK